MRLRELFTTTLNELKMAPGSLKKMSATIKGLCGIEFELYVPDVDTDDELENDYSNDPSCYSIDDIADFFSDGDWNYGSLESFKEQMREKYDEYANEEMADQFNNEAYEIVREYIVENDWDEDDKYQEAYIELDYSDEEIAACERWRNGEETDEDKNSWSGPKFSQARTKVEEMLDEAVEESISNYDSNYDSARENWEQNAEWPDEQDFLRAEGIRRMSDVESQYDLYWPHQRGGGSSIEDLAQTFENAIGRKVVGCVSGYHGCEDQKGESYVIETDSSLSDAQNGYTGIEIVAPVLPLSEMVDEIKEVMKWANDYGCYTDSHCGLHVNISIEDIPMNNLDYVKLALFIGDNYILKEFNRQTNSFCASALDQLKSKVNISPNMAFEVLGKLQQNLSSVAGRLIHNGTTDKYVSLNVQENRLEVRSPGGDWLNEDLAKLENMVHRFIVALDIACDPLKYKEEYAKKMYKLVNPGGDNKAADAFSRYNAGMINIETLQKELYSKSVHPRTPLGNKTKPYDNVWNVVSLAGHEITVQADTAIAAIGVARKQLKLNSVQYPNHTFTVTPVVQGDMFSNLHPDKLSPQPKENPLPKQPETPSQPSARERIMANTQQNIEF